MKKAMKEMKTHQILHLPPRPIAAPLLLGGVATGCNLHTLYKFSVSTSICEKGLRLITKLSLLLHRFGPSISPMKSCDSDRGGNGGGDHLGRFALVVEEDEENEKETHPTSPPFTAGIGPGRARGAAGSPCWTNQGLPLVQLQSVAPPPPATARGDQLFNS